MIPGMEYQSFKKIFIFNFFSITIYPPIPVHLYPPLPAPTPPTIATLLSGMFILIPRFCLQSIPGALCSAPRGTGAPVMHGRGVQSWLDAENSSDLLSIPQDRWGQRPMSSLAHSCFLFKKVVRCT